MAEIVTMSSVRLEEERRSVPLDAAKFLVEANALGRNLSKTQAEPGEGFSHLHLVGDASVLAVKIAETSADAREAIKRLRAFLLDDKSEKDIEDRLKPVVDEREKLVRSMARAVRRNITVSSATKFLRENKELSSRLLDELALVFSPQIHVNQALDFAEMKRVVRGGEGSDARNGNLQAYDLNTLSHVALDTLPLRLLSLPPAEQSQQSFYAGVEGFFGGRLVEDEKYYLSYKGPEVKKDKPTIIENMKLLVQATVFFVLQDHERAKRLEKAFIIDPVMDGMGFQNDAVPIKCDPHTSDLSSAVYKLPLLAYMDGKFCPVQAGEFRETVKTGTGGISGSKTHAWLHNLGVITAYLDEDPSKWPERIKTALNAYSITEQDLKSWLLEAKKHVTKNRKGLPQRKLDPLIPRGELDFTSELVSIIGEDIVCGMYNEGDVSEN